MDEQAYREQARQDGYEEPVLVTWEPGTVNEQHVHDYAARLFVLSGEMTVTRPDRERTCRAGDIDGLDKGVPHAERIGPEGVRFLVARKR